MRLRSRACYAEETNDLALDATDVFRLDTTDMRAAKAPLLFCPERYGANDPIWFWNWAGKGMGRASGLRSEI